MSELAATSGLRAVAGELRRQQVMDLVRGATFVGTLLLAWMTLRPFVDLGNQQLKDTTTGNETLPYLVFGIIAVLTVALAMRDNIAPPTLNLDNPSVDTPINLVPKVPISKQIDIALSNSFGFGGTNASLIFRKVA